MELVYPQIVTGADLLRGIIKLDELAPLLKRRGAVSCGIVNSKLYGVRSFSKVMKKHGIHPVIGLSAMIEIEGADPSGALLYMYAKDDEGYRNLVKASSAASTREGTIPLKWLEAYSKGCVVVCPLTDPSWESLRSEDAVARLRSALRQAELYIGISRAGGEIHDEEEPIVLTAGKLGLPITACYEARFLDKSDAFSYEVAEAIRQGYKLNDSGRPRFSSQAAYTPEKEELQAWFHDRPQWLAEAGRIMLSCDAEIEPGRQLMPVFPVPGGESAPSYLRKRSEEGLSGRIPSPDAAYMKRLQYELDIISKMGFADYFLIVEDFMRYARETGVLTGPGRGSSAGSLVAYALRITDVDPVKYGLIFERFLNPGRVTMPDIDIDFADNRRGEVIDYVARKYGKNHVAQIITFGTLSAKSVARNVARVFDFSNEEMSFISKQIQDGNGKHLEQVASRSQALQKWIALDPIRQKWLQAAIALEGLPRNASTHAAGVVLAPCPLVDAVPVQSGGDEIYLTQWAMGDVEEQGLLKMDFLGLRNLTLLDRMKSMIEFDTGRKIDFSAFPLNDQRTFELFRRGDMTGIFQFESEGMRDALRTIRPERFEDLYAINALYRPGPMENIPLYSRRKNGHESVHYIHPLLESVLKETFGIIVYQEQIMEIAVKVAGFSMAEADLLRRAVSKKKREIMREERSHFISSAERNGVQAGVAEEIYDLIVKFADYGFPKSHAVAYSLISYRLAFLKAHETPYFYAALLGMAGGNDEKTMELIREMKEHDIEVLPPSINRSKYLPTVEKGAIRIGLGMIKGVSPSVYETIRRARRKGTSWKSLFDMAAAMGSEFNEKSAAAFIHAGALDEFGENRAVLLASVDAAKKHAAFVSPDGDDLLEDIIRQVASPKYTPAGTMPRMLMLENERDVLGFYLSEHPAVELKKRLDKPVADICTIPSMRDRAFVTAIGLIIDIKRIRTKKGEAMAFLKLQDETGEISCTCFPKQYAAQSKVLEEMTIVTFSGTVERRNGQPQLIVQSIDRIQ